MTEYDRILQEMATKNWQQFVTVIGEDAIVKAKMCLLMQEGYSYNGVAIKLGVTANQVRYKQQCKNCKELPRD